ncbi:FMN-binding protein [Guggenheimella bovis]
MKKKHSTLYTALFMLLVTVITVGSLAALTILTKDAVTANETKEVKLAILKAAGMDPTEKESEEKFDSLAKLVKNSPRPLYKVQTDKGEVLVFEYTGNALWGSVTGYLGIDPSLKTLKGLAITKNAETPGLGGRITERWFQKQFEGIEVKEGAFITYRPNPGGNVDAITGATLTSNSIKDIILKEVPAFISEYKGGQYEK